MRAWGVQRERGGIQGRRHRMRRAHGIKSRGILITQGSCKGVDGGYMG
jgi:hypothetical protein